MSDEKYQRVELGKYIVADPYICHGQPTFKGTRKIVHLIVRSFCSGWTIDEIAKRHRLPKEAVEEAINLAAESILEMYAVPYPEPVPVEEVLVKTIEAVMPPSVDDLPLEYREEFLSMESLSDYELLKVADLPACAESPKKASGASQDLKQKISLQNREGRFERQWYDTHVRNPLVEQNTFIRMPMADTPLPTFENSKAFLPEPFWQGHEQTIACYWKAWELAFGNLRQPTPENGYVSNYIDTAFNNGIFMWDSAFILMFGRYGHSAFNFLGTLDNFYAKQHSDGFICREIDNATGSDRFHRYAPPSTGPNIMGWTEWHYYLNFGDKQRLAKVLPVLRAYHQWLRVYRTWPDGTYWYTGWCAMDNQPRIDFKQYHTSRDWSHGHMSWVDASLWQILSANVLVAMGRELGAEDEVADMRAENERLIRFVNEHFWDDASAYYYDRWRDGTLNGVKSIASYWALLADVVPKERLARFVAHLENPKEFSRLHRVPSLSADHPEYDPKGGCWLGSVWAPTTYMVLRSLTHVGYEDLAYEIARNHLENVVEVFRKTGTLWENYAPDFAEQGNYSKPDFVGWTGLPPIAVLFEYVFGLRPDVPNGTLVWDVRLLEEHGVRRYPFGRNGLLELRCAKRSSAAQKPDIEVSSTVPLTTELRWQGGTETVKVRGNWKGTVK